MFCTSCRVFIELAGFLMIWIQKISTDILEELDEVGQLERADDFERVNGLEEITDPEGMED